jgi:hypothetical protein
MPSSGEIRPTLDSLQLGGFPALTKVCAQLTLFTVAGNIPATSKGKEKIETPPMSQNSAEERVIIF